MNLKMKLHFEITFIDLLLMFVAQPLPTIHTSYIKLILSFYVTALTFSIFFNAIYFIWLMPFLFLIKTSYILSIITKPYYVLHN